MTTNEMLILAYLVCGAAWSTFRLPHAMARSRPSIETASSEFELAVLVGAVFITHILLALIWPITAVAWLALRPRRF